MRPDDYIKMQALQRAAQPGAVRAALPYAGAALGVGALYGANVFAGGGDERWDRTAINTGGNLAGAALGYRLGGIPGAVVGGLAGGYLSDRVADQFDDTDGRMQASNALDLLNQHLSALNPYQQEAMLSQRMDQARVSQRDHQKAIREAAIQQYEAEALRQKLAQAEAARATALQQATMQY